MSLGDYKSMQKEPGGPADARFVGLSVEALESENERLRKALGAVLLFYRVGPWDDSARLKWLMLTGKVGATTKILCDTVRAALSK